MARAPDKRKEKAKELYESGMMLIEIANQLNVPEGTVRSWKNRGKWDCNATQENKCNVANKNNVPTKKEKPIASEVESEVINDDLTDKQRLFCMFYVQYRNKVKAYQKAYQCSYENACGHASELWKKVEIRKEIQKLLDEYRANVDIDINDLFQWYLDIARADINDFVKINDNMIKVRNGSEIDGTLISEIKEGQYGVSVKLFDKQKAMSWLSEHIGLANEEQIARIALLKAKANSGDSSDSENQVADILRGLTDGIND